MCCFCAAGFSCCLCVACWLNAMDFGLNLKRSSFKSFLARGFYLIINLAWQPEIYVLFGVDYFLCSFLNVQRHGPRISL